MYCLLGHDVLTTGPSPSWLYGLTLFAVVQISANGKTTSLGDHDTEEEAARAFDRAAINKDGSRARTNFPVDQYETEIDDLQSALLPICVLKTSSGSPRRLLFPILVSTSQCTHHAQPCSLFGPLQRSTLGISALTMDSKMAFMRLHEASRCQTLPRAAVIGRPCSETSISSMPPDSSSCALISAVLTTRAAARS